MISSFISTALAIALIFPVSSTKAIESNSTRVHATAPNDLITLASSFAADASIDVSILLLNSAKRAKANVLATYPSRSDRAADVAIHGDWQNLPGVSAWHFVADVDVDCDGSNACAHDDDQQSTTSWGALDASRVPFYVLPASLAKNHKELKPNALGAVICGKRIFYGIFGDENGDSPQVIGEASVLLARACFPNDRLDGGNGHDQLDVTYIIFPTQVPANVGKTTIDMAALKALGDSQIRKLIAALGKNKIAGEVVAEEQRASSAHIKKLVATSQKRHHRKRRTLEW